MRLSIVGAMCMIVTGAIVLYESVVATEQNRVIRGMGLSESTSDGEK